MHSDDQPERDVGEILAILIHANGEKWLRFATKVLGNVEDAEDVIQEAVQRVLLRNREFPSQEDARMYLARAISNTAIEHYHARRRERLKRIPLDERLFPALDASSPQEVLEQREISDRTEQVLTLLEQGLSQLPAKQYEAIQLVVLDPLAGSIREAGCEKGIPYSTLRHRSLQGLRSLRRFVRKAIRKAQEAANGRE